MWRKDELSHSLFLLLIGVVVPWIVPLQSASNFTNLLPSHIFHFPQVGLFERSLPLPTMSHVLPISVFEPLLAAMLHRQPAPTTNFSFTMGDLWDPQKDEIRDSMRQIVVKCSERCLYQFAKWFVASPLLCSVED